MLISEHAPGMPCWIDLRVETHEQHHDLRAFLSALFGWSWNLDTTNTGDVAIAENNGAPILALGIGDGHGEMTTYFSTDSLSNSLRLATDLGAEVMLEPGAAGELGSLAVLRDPSGAVFGFWQAEKFTGFAQMYELNTPGWFDHVSANPARDAKFYEEMLGHKTTTIEPDRIVLQHADQWLASLSPLQFGDIPRWSPIFVVDSLERVHETVTRHGGAILAHELPVPGSAICVFTEPVNGTIMTVMRAGEVPS